MALLCSTAIIMIITIIITPLYFVFYFLFDYYFCCILLPYVIKNINIKSTRTKNMLNIKMFNNNQSIYLYLFRKHKNTICQSHTADRTV